MNFFSPIPISPVFLVLLLLAEVLLIFVVFAQAKNVRLWKITADVAAKRAFKMGREAEAKLHKAPLDVRINDAYQRGIRDCNHVWVERLEKGRCQIDPPTETPNPEPA
jgi:hypothetical protein